MPQWRRTLYTVWFTQFIAVLGFSFVTPFIPYYVQELGVTGVEQVALWAGFATAIQSVTQSIMAPVWGSLADRHGRKLMVLRATFAAAVVMTMMGLVTTVHQLVLLRALQGVLTGTVAATTILVASIVPKEQSGMALGSLQTAISLGVSLGPLVGGLMGDAFGYRPSFWITGGLLFLSGILVLVLVKEDFHPAPLTGSAKAGHREVMQIFLAAGGGLAALFVARVVLRLGTQLLGPVMPLFVQSLLPPGARVASIAGLIAGGTSLGTALGAPIAGRLGDRAGHRRVLIVCALAAAACYLPQAFVPNPWWLIFWQLLTGIAIGGTLATLAALLISYAPAGHEGAIFGLDSSVQAAAAAAGPLIGASVAAGIGLQAPFVASAAILILGTIVVITRLRGPAFTGGRAADVAEMGVALPGTSKQSR